jgi:predicted small lipoprotein YifL
VKSPFALPAAAFAGLATLVLLSGCGQTGPLYMSKPPNRPATAPAAPAAGPVIQSSPPAPAAGITPPVAGSNANNTQAIPSAAQPGAQSAPQSNSQPVSH